MWTEKDSDGIVIHKLRLEKTDKSASSWWMPKNSAAEQVGQRAYPDVRGHCDSCNKESKQVFTQGWACLNAGCDKHFVLATGETITDLDYAADNAALMAWCIECKQPSKTVFGEGWTCLHKRCSSAFEFAEDVDTSKLTYSREILLERTACATPAQPIRPDLPSFQEATTDIAFRRGIVCPQCHGCSRRRDWDRWTCETEGCDFVISAPPQPLSLAEISRENEEALSRKKFKNPVTDPSVETFTATMGGYDVDVYLFPQPTNHGIIIGTVHVFRATDRVNSRRGGADQLWAEIQDSTGRGFSLSRNPVRTPGRKSSPFILVLARS